MIYTPPNKKNNNNYYFFIKNHKTQRIWRYHKLVVIHNECYPQGLGARPALRAWMVATSVLKDLAKTLSSMPVVNKVLGSDTVPAFALPKAEIARAISCISALYWKCTSPLGKTNTSPFCSVWVKSLLVVSTNPTWRVPWLRKRSSEARGWMWVGLGVPAGNWSTA